LFLVLKECELQPGASEVAVAEDFAKPWVTVCAFFVEWDWEKGCAKPFAAARDAAGYGGYDMFDLKNGPPQASSSFF
jgi:hypothetical protein